MKSGSKVKAWFEKLIKDLRAILDKAYNILKGQKSWEQMELIRNNKQTLDMIADYYFEGMEGTKGKAANEDGKVSFSPRLDPDFGSSVDIEKNYRAVANMQPVAKVKGTEFAKGEVDLITQVSNFFEEIGGEVISPDLGRIILDRNGVKDDIAHGIGRNKAAAFVAVPDVIKKGKILDVQYNWKGRGYDTVIVAAPVVFSGQNAIEGVILRKKSINDDFYLHEIKIEGVSTFKTGANKIGAPSADTPSVISILQKVFDYKEKSDGNVKRSAKDSGANIREVNPMEITPPNRVTSSNKYHYLINEFENNGYNGRNVVLVENGNDGYQALTGSHRILAAREAGVDVPSVVIPMSEEIQPLLDATGDEERARIADELYEDGVIPKEARDLLVREDELNFENLGKPLDKQVRFSRKDDVSVTSEDAKKLQKQNDKLKQALEVAKQEIKLSDGHHVKASAVERLAGKLLKEYSSKMDKAELVSNITELFDYIGNGENVVWDEVQAGAMNIALNVLDQSAKRNTEWYDNTKPAREFLFQSTLPTRGSDYLVLAIYPIDEQISIHAPHEGERRHSANAYTTDRHFNPRSPRGGATKCPCRTLATHNYFNPRSPRGGATMSRGMSP